MCWRFLHAVVFSVRFPEDRGTVLKQFPKWKGERTTTKWKSSQKNDTEKNKIKFSLHRVLDRRPLPSSRQILSQSSSRTPRKASAEQLQDAPVNFFSSSRSSSNSCDPDPSSWVHRWPQMRSSSVTPLDGSYESSPDVVISSLSFWRLLFSMSFGSSFSLFYVCFFSFSSSFCHWHVDSLTDLRGRHPLSPSSSLFRSLPSALYSSVLCLRSLHLQYIPCKS